MMPSSFRGYGAMFGMASGAKATFDLVYPWNAPPPQAGGPAAADAAYETGELRADIEGPNGTMRVALPCAARPCLTESGVTISMMSTLTRITPSASTLGDMLSEQDRIVARASAPAKPVLRRLQRAEKAVGRRIVTLK